MLVCHNSSFRDLWLSAQDAARNTAMPIFGPALVMFFPVIALWLPGTMNFR